MIASHSTASRCPQPALAAPRMLPSNHPLFWVAALLRDSLHLQNMQRLHERTFKNRNQDTELQDAVGMACVYLRREVQQSAREAQRDGVLLFAWPGTRALEGEGVAA